MKVPGIVPLAMTGEGEKAGPAPDRVLAGRGLARVWNAFSAPGGAIHAGHWQGGAGRVRVAYDESELCVILAGRVRLTAASGESADFGPGDAFVVAPGFAGVWENIGEVTKIYAISEP